MINMRQVGLFLPNYSSHDVSSTPASRPKRDLCSVLIALRVPRLLSKATQSRQKRQTKGPTGRRSGGDVHTLHDHA